MEMYQETRRCPRCDQDRPTTEFYVKNKATGQLMSWCKPCYAEVGRERYEYRKRGEQRPRKPSPAPASEKTCTDCTLTLPSDRFRPQRRRCRDCEKAAYHRYLEEHPDKVAESQARYREQHREEMRAKAKERYANDDRYGPAKHRQWRRQNPEPSRAATKRHKLAHPESNAVRINARRARKLQVGGTYTVQEWQALKAKYGHQCLACKRTEPEITLTADHVIPLVRGGSNGINNIQPLCGPCNSRKHTGTTDFRPFWSTSDGEI